VGAWAYQIPGLGLGGDDDLQRTFAVGCVHLVWEDLSIVHALRMSSVLLGGAEEGGCVIGSRGMRETRAAVPIIAPLLEEDSARK